MAASILIVYYSMTGRTRPVANELCRATNADLEEIREPERRTGLPGIFRALFDALLRRRTEIVKPMHDPAHYDLVILGGPIWAGRLASPVRSFARKYGPRAKQLAFFCTAGGPKADAAFADLQRLCDRAPRATCLVDASHLEPEAHRGELAHFVAQALRASTHAHVNAIASPAPGYRAPAPTPRR